MISVVVQGMGWRAGEGLGRDNDGITAPIEVQLRAERSGLGSGGSSSAAEYVNYIYRHTYVFILFSFIF